MQTWTVFEDVPHIDPVLYADIFMQMIEIEFQAHEPKKITIKKKAGESFGMKLGTRVFVQGLTKDGLADKEGVSEIFNIQRSLFIIAA